MARWHGLSAAFSLCLAGATSAILLAAPPVLAQTAEELKEARQIFNEGKQLEDKGSWAEALEKFKKVAGVKMTPQVRFHIALCEENLGKLASAIRGFELAAEEARSAGSSATEVANNAPTRAEALKKRVGTLKLAISGTLTTSKIYLDDVALPPSAGASPSFIDPGAHVIEVRDGSGTSTFKKEITVAEGASERVEITVHDGESKGPVKEEPVAPPPPPPSSRVPAYVVGGVGAASLIVSGVFFGMRQSSISTVKSHCKGADGLTQCDPKDQDTASAGKTDGTVSGAMLGIGIAGVVTGTVLFFVLGPKKSESAKSTLHLVPTADGIGVGGSF